MSGLLKRLLSPSVVLIAGQGASSASNMLLAVLVARASTPREFGAFALALPLWLIAQRVLRVLFHIPRQVRHHAPGQSNLSACPPWLLCSTLALCMGVAAAAAALPFGGTIALWALAMGICLPPTLAYDCTRNELLVLGKHQQVAISDLLWLGLQVLLSGLVLGLNLPAVYHLGAWALPPLVIAAVHVVTNADHWASPAPVRAELAIAKGRLADGVTDVLSTVLAVQSIPYMIAWLTSLAQTAGFRGALTMMGPSNVIMMGLMPLLQMSTAAQPHRGQVLRRVARYSAVTGGVTLILGVGLWLLPDSIGRMLLGSTWPIAQTFLLPITLQTVLRTPMMGTTTSLRSMAPQALLVRQRIETSLVTFAGAAVGALWGGALAAAWGLVVATLLASAWSLYLLLTKVDWAAPRVSGV